jgi:hypothetical protein
MNKRVLLCNIEFNMSLEDFITQLTEIKLKYAEDYDSLYVKREFIIDTDFFRVYGELKVEK